MAGFLLCRLDVEIMIEGDDIRQKLEFLHGHLELGALGDIETFFILLVMGFFSK